MVVQLAAAVAALALCMVAWGAVRIAEAEEDQACLARAEMTALARANANFGVEEARQAFAACGLRLSVRND